MNITDTLLQHVLKHWPEQVAIIDDEQQLTYGELYQQTEQLTTELRRFRCGQGDNIRCYGT
ncbi:AMP-binding protein [Methylocucumis oryzae]|uniref:AMP-dependent synthetase/ligase domain-containing protein n=1 Tax=Methylocucumis oryzae TaxID=1632867 RepID=A0A0F3IJ97_9GAMM|nr:AMP-binding protein [Methylocucumis oryzae]KJV06747.1 hypothetical protein VZ94_09320 [Methylocucumis oryzae]